MQNSQFLLMVKSGDISTLKKVINYLKCGEVMRKESLEHASLPCAALDHDILNEECYRVDSTGAVVTFSSSISLIYFYCSRLPSDGYYKFYPRCLIEKELKTCMMIFPKNCPFRSITVSGGNIKMLKQLACLEACKKLHLLGALTDNLVPDIVMEEAVARDIGGTASYLLGMSERVASQADAGNTPNNVKNLNLHWMIPYLFVVSFVGLFSIVPLRKMMIMKYNLTYPSGTTTAYLINSFHTPKGAKVAKKQVGTLFKTFPFRFLFACFQWFWNVADGCGFGSSVDSTAFRPLASRPLLKGSSLIFSPTYVSCGQLLKPRKAYGTVLTSQTAAFMVSKDTRGNCRMVNHCIKNSRPCS